MNGAPTIVQIVFKPNSDMIFGLSSDSMVYLYNSSAHTWSLWARTNENDEAFSFKLAPEPPTKHNPAE